MFQFLNTDAGRAAFWAESAVEQNGMIHFEFINGVKGTSPILKRLPNEIFQINYFDTLVTFHLKSDGQTGTDLNLINQGIPDWDYLEVYAGWLSVLFALKGAVDFGIDLRNHDPNRTWDDRFIEN